MTHYTKQQIAILRALNTLDKTLFNLAGHWYFGQKVPGFGRLKPSVLPENIAHIAKNCWTVANMERDQFESDIEAYNVRNETAFLLSCMMWEHVFPEDMQHSEVSRLAIEANLEVLSPANAKDWVEAKLDRSTGLRGAMARVATQDCYRLAHTEDVSKLDCYDRDHEGQPRPAGI